MSILTAPAPPQEHPAHCQRCKLSKELLPLSSESSNRSLAALAQLWQTYLALDHHDISPLSTSKFSRGMGIAPDALPKADPSNVNSTFDCLKLMWTTSLVDSERWFENRMHHDPRCALLYAENALLRALLIGDNNSRDGATEKLGTVESVAEQLVKKWEPAALKLYESRAEDRAKLLKTVQNLRLALCVQAEAALLRSGMQLLKKKLTSGALNFRKAWKLYQRVQKLGEAQRRAQAPLSAEEAESLAHTECDIENLLQFGQGALALGVSMVPESVGALIRMASGQIGSQGSGIQCLYKCINAKRGLRTPLALTVVLFWLLIYIPDFVPGRRERYCEAGELIKFGLHYYPCSPYFLWLESYMHQKQGNLELSLKLMTKVIAKSKALGLPTTSCRLEFERGWVLFVCQDWDSAIECLETAGKAGALTDFTLLVLGAAYCMTGDLAAAESTLEYLVNSPPEGSQGDRWVQKRASRYLERRWFQLFPYEIMYVTDYLQSQQREWLENVLAFLNTLQVTEEEIEEFAVKALLEGAVLRQLGRLREASAAVTRATDRAHEVFHESWVLPHLFYEQGLVAVRSRDWLTAGAFLRKAKHFKKNYEFKKALSYKLGAALEQVAQEENKEHKK